MRILKIFPKCMVLLLLMMLSCKKDVAGPKGEKGASGPPGNLSQTYISSFNLPVSGWKQNQTLWESVITVPEITENVVKSCEVKVYIKSDSVWWSLPHVNRDVFTQCSLKEGKVLLSSYKLHGAPGPQPGNATFRVVILLPS